MSGGCPTDPVVGGTQGSAEVVDPNVVSAAVKPEEQQRIEASLRRRLAQPPYPPLFDLPKAHLVATRKYADWKPGSPACSAKGHAREPRSPVIPGGHNDYVVRCAKAKDHDGLHSTYDEKIPFSKGVKRWEWSSDSPTQATGLPPEVASP